MQNENKNIILLYSYNITWPNHCYLILVFIVRKGLLLVRRIFRRRKMCKTGLPINRNYPTPYPFFNISGLPLVMKMVKRQHTHKDIISKLYLLIYVGLVDTTCFINPCRNCGQLVPIQGDIVLVTLSNI